MTLSILNLKTRIHQQAGKNLSQVNCPLPTIEFLFTPLIDVIICFFATIDHM